MIGIIGGSGLYDGIEGIEGKEKIVKTEYGDVKVFIGNSFAFVSRHGNPPKPPHRVNYHANIMAFRELNVKNIVAISTVGSLKDNIKPGSFLMPSNLLDFTNRVWTYHDNEPYHVNMYEPFCKELRVKINEKLSIPVGGTYATMKGPQFETAAEANMLRILGADIVGMTVAPEAKLAKELNLCYQPICIVVNYVDGKTSHKENLKVMKELNEQLKKLIQELSNFA